MRMKKFLILAATVALSAACSHNYEVTPVVKDAGQIAFGSWADNLTRTEARVQGSNDWGAGDTFAVYGVKTDTDPDPDTTITVFDDVVVTASGSPVTWDYENHRFWDLNCESYTFYAISPSAVGTAATVTPATGEITSASITFAGNDNDILVADKKVVLKGSDPYFNNFGTVPLTFNHIASLFDLIVKKTNTITATVAVTSVSLTNMDATGTFSVSDAYNSTAYNGASGLAPVVTWNVPTQGTGTYTNASGVGGTVTLPSNVTGVATINDSTKAAGDTLIRKLVIMPQTLRHDANIQTLNITYTIQPTGGDLTTNTVAIPLYDFDISHDTANDGTAVDTHKFLTGKHYTFYVTLDAHAIMFTATINDWTAQPGYYYLMN